MKRLAILFVVAVVTPCCVLAWLALRALHEEEAASGRQRVTSAQQQTEAVAGSVNDVMAAQIHELEQQVDHMLQSQPAAAVAATFDDQIRQRWATAQVGFALHAQDGKLVSPVKYGESRVEGFMSCNAGFLAQGISVPAYSFTSGGGIPVEPARPTAPEVASFEKGRSFAGDLKNQPLATVVPSEPNQLSDVAVNKLASAKTADKDLHQRRNVVVAHDFTDAAVESAGAKLPSAPTDAPTVAAEFKTKENVDRQLRGLQMDVPKIPVPEAAAQSATKGVETRGAAQKPLEEKEEKLAPVMDGIRPDGEAAKAEVAMNPAAGAVRYKLDDSAKPNPTAAPEALGGANLQTALAPSDPTKLMEPADRNLEQLPRNEPATAEKPAPVAATSSPQPASQPPASPAPTTAPALPPAERTAGMDPAPKNAASLPTEGEYLGKSKLAAEQTPAPLAPTRASARKDQPAAPESKKKADKASSTITAQNAEGLSADGHLPSAPAGLGAPPGSVNYEVGGVKTPFATADKQAPQAPASAAAAPAPPGPMIADGSVADEFGIKEPAKSEPAEVSKSKFAPPEGKLHFRSPNPAPAEIEETRKQMLDSKQAETQPATPDTPPVELTDQPTELSIRLAGEVTPNPEQDFDKDLTRWNGVFYDRLGSTQNAPSAPVTGTISNDDFFESRSVSPVHLSASQQSIAGSVSLVRARQLRFDELWSQERSGLLSRFADDGSLVLIAWHRPPAAPDFIYGVQLAAEALLGPLTAALRREGADTGEFCFALLDQSNKPVGKTLNGFAADWRRPFVSTEIGAALPRWEVAAYLIDPLGATAAGKSARWRLGLLVLTVLAAAFVGAWLIWREARRRLVEARQKTDFVSNVSHELRTPLTSIRMFSDLLAEPTAEPNAEKTRKYAEVISQEAGRLTRLINNVLDFSRLERGQTPVRLEPLDLNALVAETIDNYRPHIESQGFTLRSVAPAGEVSIQGDRDRLSQVLLNLLSNAEKYGGGETKEIDVTLAAEPGAKEVVLTVSDRGPGVPRGREKRIFDKFYRADDALASGVQGSGLGLTLARQIARSHEGDLTCQRRDGGGSVFRLTLPAGGTT